MTNTASFVRPVAAVPAVSPVTAGRPLSAEPAAEGDQAFARLLEQQRNAPRPPQAQPQPKPLPQTLPPQALSSANSELAAAERPPQAAPVDEPQHEAKDDEKQKDSTATTKAPRLPTRQPPLLPGGLNTAASAKRPTAVEGDAGPAPVCGPAADGSDASGSATDEAGPLESAVPGTPPPSHAEMPTLPPLVALPLSTPGQGAEASNSAGTASGATRAGAGRRDAASDRGLVDTAADAAARVPADAAANTASHAAAAAKAELQDQLAAAAAGRAGADAPGRSEAGAAPVGTRLPPDTSMAPGTPASPSLAGPAATGPTAEAPLPARPGSPAFAPQLGAQISTWVRAGVQEARLQLNPAEMGPVLVTIELAGAAAQVSFSAANAETRQALEAALPALAYSLSETGLTLSGGGVFEQAPQREQGRERAADGTPRRPASGESAAPAAPVRSARTRGVVDLIA